MLPVLFYICQNTLISKVFSPVSSPTDIRTFHTTSSNLLLRFRIWFSYPFQKKTNPRFLESDFPFLPPTPVLFRKMGVPLCFRVAIADPSTSSESQGGPHLTEWADPISPWANPGVFPFARFGYVNSLNIEIWHSNFSRWSLWQKPFPVWWGAYVSSFSGRVIFQPLEKLGAFHLMKMFRCCFNPKNMLKVDNLHQSTVVN